MYRPLNFFGIDQYNLFLIRKAYVANINIPGEYSIEISITRKNFKEIIGRLEKILSIYGININDIDSIPAKIYETSPNIRINNKSAIITENDGNENWLITNQNVEKYKSISLIVKIDISKILSYSL